MKTMHWLGVITTTLISLNVLTACSGDDAPAAPTGGTSSTGGTGATGGTGVTGGTGTGGGFDNTGTAIKGASGYVYLSSADAPAGSAAPPIYSAMSTTCSTCHGVNAEGFNGAFPEIRFTPKEYLKAVVRGGRKDIDGKDTGMAAFDATKISDADLELVATWVTGLPKPTTGEGLYKAMCGNCHGPTTPTGGGSPIKIQGAPAADVDKYVRMGNGTIADYNNRKEYMPAYDTTLLTDAELALIKTFIGAK
jgi:mono/diheme cytochrome c family protein